MRCSGSGIASCSEAAADRRAPMKDPIALAADLELLPAACTGRGRVLRGHDRRDRGVRRPPKVTSPAVRPPPSHRVDRFDGGMRGAWR
jgi:hypothetical protein